MSEENASRQLMDPSETDLILRAQNGDSTAFERLVHRYDRRVFSMAAGYVSTAEDAKDIFQEVFLRVYRGLPNFELRSEFSTWLYRIATNVCLSHRSQQRRYGHVSLRDETENEDEARHSRSPYPTAEGHTDQYTMDSDISAHVEDALEKLSPQQKLVFTLRHYEGFKLREIAEMMRCSQGTVKKYLFTATRRMRELLKDIFE